jgi:hypothetical protein
MKQHLLFLALPLIALTSGCGLADTAPESEDDLLAESAQSPLSASGAWCTPIPSCDAAPPAPGARVRWNHTLSAVTVALGKPNHRGRDLFLNPDDPQWAIAKFSYGIFDKDLKDEQVDVYLLRGCGDTWELLGTATTTEDDEHEAVEGVDDSGGRVYFEIPASKRLEPGRHRVRFVVRGDLSSTEAFIEVVPRGAPVFVSDVDGTLTVAESEEFGALLSGRLPAVNTDAPEVSRILASKGYHAMYLTARTEWLVGRTRDFLAANSFPPGVVHTTQSATGATGAAAAEYKSEELAALADHGLVPSWAFGNTATDAQAYENAGVDLSKRVFYRFSDTAHGGRRIESYSELLSEVSALPSLCN